MLELNKLSNKFDELLNSIKASDYELWCEFDRLRGLRFNYNFYGSHDSTDKDVVFYLDKLPIFIEDRKRLTALIKKELKVDWNPILAKVENGIVVDCTYPKASPESLNNSIFDTYNYHKQDFLCPVTRLVERNVILAIYKTIRLLLTYLTRTEHRTLIRPTVHWSFDLKLKIRKLQTIDFSMLEKFNQPNMKEVDIWKTWCFYVVQNKALLSGQQIYTKLNAIEYEPNSYNFIYRKELTLENKKWFNSYVYEYLNLLYDLDIKQKENILSLYHQDCDMKKELPL